MSSRRRHNRGNPVYRGPGSVGQAANTYPAYNYPDYSPQKSYEGDEWSGTGATVNRSIVRIDIDGTVKKVAPLVRHFRENAIYTVEAYEKLLDRMCKACGVPDYQKNRPIFSHDPNVSTWARDRGLYRCGTEKKSIILRHLADLRGFLCLWYLYLKSRNQSFTSLYEDRAIYSKGCPENRYSKEVMDASEPQRILRLEQRRYMEETEL